MAKSTVKARVTGWVLLVSGALVMVGAVLIAGLWLLLDMFQNFTDAPQRGGHTNAEFNRALLECVVALLGGGVVAWVGGALAARD